MSGIITEHEPFGTLLGYAPGGVAIYSSDYDTITEAEKEDDISFRSYIGNEYMGYKWQCVEFARRFLYLNYGVVFTDVGMAYEIFPCVFCVMWWMTVFCRCVRLKTAASRRR